MGGRFLKFFCWSSAFLLSISELASGSEESATPTNGCRVVRIAFRNNGKTFLAQINQGTRLEKYITEFTNWVSELQLSYGDVVAWQSHRNENGKELSIPLGASSWFNRHLTNHLASWFWLPEDDIYKLSVYHWKVPIEDWQSVTNASFYLEGRLMGRGAEGFRAMLNKIETTRPKKFWILGCHLRRFDDQPESGWAYQANALTQFEKIEPGYLMDLSRDF